MDGRRNHVHRRSKRWDVGYDDRNAAPRRIVRPGTLTPEQFTAIVIALGSLATALAALVGAVVRLWSKVEENKRLLNGRMDQLVIRSRQLGHAEGIALAERLHAGGDEDGPVGA
jgi:hypothetical protein